MFTGIVREIGTVLESTSGPTRATIRIGCHDVLKGVEAGSSLAVNGVCLTVAGLGSSWFDAELMPETLRRTGLGKLGRGARVNLETSLRLGSPLDGHLLQGHVDAIAEVTAIKSEGDSLRVSVRLPRELLRYVASQGSVALDGVSLTVIEVTDDQVAVGLIPQTLSRTIAADYHVGQVVNIEVDLVARYLERLMAVPQPSSL